ncbi:cell envelope integrity protein TolA [Rhodoferax ferrireducens]|uniref:cell envelope integrity protein TolA n=1 Tax=Rhodoferax ferrireducens TaxID=192843 RepID=UPI000E0D76D3|nr:cell envelope integrity protein TolA [Rhodoferax ferrireducens]
MHAATDRLEFAPPPTPGLTRALGLAVLAHVFLLAALTWGVHWKREAVTVTAEAELWSATPQQAAPKLVEVPPEPPETPKPPVIKPAPKPTPPPPQAQPKQPDADIALEREKLRLKKEKQDDLEKQRLAKLKQEKLKQEKVKEEKLEQEKLKQEKLLAKRELDKKAAENKKKTEQETQRKEAVQAQLDAKKLEAQRQENIKRMTGLAGATGSPGATGTALHASGPSASYAGRIRASIKPNIVFVDEVVGNPMAEVEVKTAPDGTIISRKLLKPSADKSWDDAVLRAIDKTEKLPRDVDGRVPNSLVISFRPKD